MSHWITVRSGIAAFSIGTRRVEPVARDDEAADVLRQVARKADQSCDQCEPVCTITGLAGIEAGLAQPLGLASVLPSHHAMLAGEPFDLVERQAERLADVAQRARAAGR